MSAFEELCRELGAYLLPMALRLAILTTSDADSRSERSDFSGDLIASQAKERGHTLAERARWSPMNSFGSRAS